MADAEGNVLFANRTMERFASDVGLADTGTIWDRMVALARRTTTPDAYYDVFARIAADPAAAIDDEFTLADSNRTFSAYTVGVKDPSGRVIGRIFSIHEITALRESERLKDEFVATVSHELRTPLTSIVGYTELLLSSTELDETQREFMEIVDRNAHRLRRLVGDLLFFAQVESRQLQLERVRVDLRALGQRGLEGARPAAEAKGLTLEFDAPAVVEVDGDKARLEQLLDNLLSPADEVAGLFRRFFRSKSAISREIPGTGLGLAIAKAIVDAHDGTIAAATSDGGTTFTVRLPRAPASADDLPATDVAAPSSA
jgi:signal transduction histidine kinase